MFKKLVDSYKRDYLVCDIMKLLLLYRSLVHAASCCRGKAKPL